MFKYCNTISELSHDIVKKYCTNFNVAVDATLGNGYDTDFLSSLFLKVYSFDIQNIAIENYKNNKKNNVILINSSHSNINNYVKERPDCIIFNLGYLPGGDKNVTTMASSTIESLKTSLKILNNGGIIIVCIYTGHKEGKKEEECILNFVQNLSKKEFSTVLHTYVNRQNNPPKLLVIEKK